MAVGTALCSTLSVLSSFKSSTVLLDRSYSTWPGQKKKKKKKIKFCQCQYLKKIEGLTIVLSLEMESSLGALESNFTPNIKSVSDSEDIVIAQALELAKGGMGSW